MPSRGMNSRVLAQVIEIENEVLDAVLQNHRIRFLGRLTPNDGG